MAPLTRHSRRLLEAIEIEVRYIAVVCRKEMDESVRDRPARSYLTCPADDRSMPSEPVRAASVTPEVSA